MEACTERPVAHDSDPFLEGAAAGRSRRPQLGLDLGCQFQEPLLHRPEDGIGDGAVGPLVLAAAQHRLDVIELLSRLHDRTGKNGDSSGVY